MMKRYLTVVEAAEYLNTSVRFVRRLVGERRIPFHHVGRHVRIAVSDLDEFLQVGRVEAVGAQQVRRQFRAVS